jgi:hypothetical protein
MAAPYRAARGRLRVAVARGGARGLRARRDRCEIRRMTHLRYVAIAVMILAGCRKETKPAPGGGGSGPAATADAQAAAADAAMPAPDAPGAVDATPAVDAPEPAGGAGGGGGGPAGGGSAGGGKGSPGAGGKGSGGGGAGAATLPEQAQPCAEGRCAPGLTCVEYYGIAGPRGGKFTSCEIRCSDGTKCPDGQVCTTIADGPGQVCRK